MEIKLTSETLDMFATIDEEDYDLISKIKWHPRKDTNTFYAHGNDYSVTPKKTVQMHRVIMNAKPGEIVDHINHDGLDNRKSNLRICNAFGNARNKTSARSSNSKYLGVWYEKRNDGRRDRYRAAIRVNGKLINLCSTQDEKEAAFKYNLAAIKYHGEFANINILNR